LKNQRDFANDARRRAGEDLVLSPEKSLDQHSDSTIPYKDYNTSNINWNDFEDVSSQVKFQSKDPGRV
jgi:hypothetical protein